MTPVNINELFELNPDYEIVETSDIIIIDNWYKNFDEIQKVMKSQTPTNYNTASSKGINDRNFKDFYDCRVIFNSTINDEGYNDSLLEMQNIVRENIDPYISLKVRNNLIFNYFKYINKPESDETQATPHIDSFEDESIIASIIYIDDICSGGTAIYDIIPENRGASGVVELNNYTNTFKYKIRRLIESKPNRLVLYPGNYWHGAYIEDNSKYVKNWRINQVNFFGVEK